MLAALPVSAAAVGRRRRRRRPCCCLCCSPAPPCLPLRIPCRYFHAYRIDHILGFFRIWEIPGDCSSGILGRFRPSIPLSRNVRWGLGLGLHGPRRQWEELLLGSIDGGLSREWPLPPAATCVLMLALLPARLRPALTVCSTGAGVQGHLGL